MKMFTVEAPRVSSVLRCLVLLLSFHGVTRGQDLGPRYRQTRSCTSDEMCNTDKGEVCWWNYKGCDKGECKCDPRVAFLDSKGFCRPVKLGGERCDETDKCPDGMLCHEGFCSCKRGTMTQDKTFCLMDNQKLLGQRCHHTQDTCFQKAAHGYTADDAECSRLGTCSCKEGHKEDGGGCRKWNVNEEGCSKDHHCQGGALCIDSRCQCPSGYKPVAGNSKCAKTQAKVDLALEDMCDEIHENRYCGQGLICHKCVGEISFKCVQFVEAQARRYANDAPFIMPVSSFCLAMAIGISAFLTILR